MKTEELILLGLGLVTLRSTPLGKGTTTTKDQERYQEVYEESGIISDVFIEMGLEPEERFEYLSSLLPQLNISQLLVELIYFDGRYPNNKVQQERARIRDYWNNSTSQNKTKIQNDFNNFVLNNVWGVETVNLNQLIQTW
jgi:hypothetical protein